MTPPTRRHPLSPVLPATALSVLLLACPLGNPGPAAAPAESASPNVPLDAAAGTDDTPAAAVIVGNLSIRPVARTRLEYGFFSLYEFQDRLYAGTYCGGRAQGQCGIWVGSPGFSRLQRMRQTLDVGESIYVMTGFRGQLYANTENRGLILRSSDGLAWERVFSGHGFPAAADQMGAGLAVFHDRLYASTTNLIPMTTRIFSSPTGDRGSWEREESFGTRQGVQIRELILFRDRLWALGYSYTAKRAAAYALGDRGGWKEITLDAAGELVGKRILKAHVWKDALWFTTSPVVGEKRVPPAGVWRWDGALANVYSDPKRAVGTAITDFNGGLWMVDMVTWNATEGQAGLHWSPTGEPGTWSEVWVFPQPEAMDLFAYHDRLYAGTRRKDGSGNVFEISPVGKE